MISNTKVPYAYLYKEVDKLYDKKFDEDDLTGIDKHCDFIVAYLHACGWDEESFIRAMFDFEDLDNKN